MRRKVSDPEGFMTDDCTSDKEADSGNNCCDDTSDDSAEKERETPGNPSGTIRVRRELLYEEDERNENQYKTSGNKSPATAGVQSVINPKIKPPGWKGNKKVR